jgi:hypothetical protein
MQNNNKTAQLYALILTSILAIGLVGIPIAIATSNPTYTNVEDSSVEENNGKMKLTVTTAEGDDIPKKADDFINSVLGFGYAWLDGNEGIVAAIHPTFDDSNQNPKAWHTHTVTIAGNNCVEVEDSQGGVVIKGNTLTLQFPKEFAGNIEPGDAVSLKLVKDDSCESGARVVAPV